MVSAHASAALQRFVDDEIMRAPLLVDQVVEAAIEHIQKGIAGMVPHDRAVAADLLQKVLSHRQHLVDYYIRSLREQVAADMKRGAPAVAAPTAPKLSLSLSLVDEEEVSVDVEISHAIEAIRSTAEYEIRELQTFVSALVGDMDVTRDHNPFRPETHARALWAAAQALPLSRGYQLTFMRHASAALAQVLRKTFAGASSRLEAAGIEPASHRTLILPAGSRGMHRPKSVESTFTPDLGRIRETMPMGLETKPQRSLDEVLAQMDTALRLLSADIDAAEHGRLREQQRQQLVENAANPVDQQQIELLSRLFDAILADQVLGADVRLLISRLQSPFIRVALREPKTMDRETHPAWRFMDRIAFLGQVLPEAPDARRERTMAFVQGLIDHLIHEPEQNASLYHWALERLGQHEQQLFEQRCAAAQREIASLQALEDRLAASSTTPSTLHGAIDLAQLDTVPAALLDDEPVRKKPATAAHQWLQQRRPSEWVRMFMQGRWVQAQLLWPGDRGELWLFGDGDSDTTWAVRRRALATLQTENLLDAIEVRSLLRDAAKRVMRRLVRPGG